MRVHCGACDQEFDFPADERSRLRCPTCLRRTGLTPVDPESKKKSFLNMPPAILGIIAVGIVGVASVGVYLWARVDRGTTPGKAAWAPPAPRSDAELTALLTAAGIDAKQVVLPLSINDDVRALAAGITVKNDAAAQLRAAAEVVGAGLRSGALKQREVTFAGGATPRTAAELALALKTADGSEASSFELALLTTAIARAAGAPALLGEGLAPLVDSDGGVRGRGPALEPSGTRGLFVAALAPETAVSAPVTARAGGPSPAEVDVRSDELVCELFYAQRALAQLTSDPEAAARDADLAARIVQASPTVASARAAIAEIVDMPETAVSIWRTAISQGGNDAPRLSSLALALLAAGDPGQAAAEARDALTLDRDDATAHAALARALASSGGDVEQAASHVEAARKGEGARAARKLALAEAALLYARGDAKGARARLDSALADSDPAVVAEAGLTLYELAIQDGDKSAAAGVRGRVLEGSKLKQRLGLRFDEIDRAYAPPPIAPDSGLSPDLDGGTPDAAKPKYNIPDGKGIPI